MLFADQVVSVALAVAEEGAVVELVALAAGAKALEICEGKTGKAPDVELVGGKTGSDAHRVVVRELHIG